jgi:hypothetical protein
VIRPCSSQCAAAAKKEPALTATLRDIAHPGVGMTTIKKTIQRDAATFAAPQLCRESNVRRMTINSQIVSVHRYVCACGMTAGVMDRFNTLGAITWNDSRRCL